MQLDTDMVHSPLRYRTVWLSDIHLGSRSCQASVVLDFLQQIECQHIYLVGDIVDVIALRRSVYWPESHTRVLQRLLVMQQQGTAITYIPGNHDDEFRAFAGGLFNGIPVKRRAIHRTANGKRLLVLHGDELDAEIRCGRWLRHLGSLGYRLLMRLNRTICRLRSALNLPYWSLATEIKHRMGRAVEFIAAFEHGMVELAKNRGVDGVVCGHIHHAAIKTVDGLLYCNDGDWVESCTALVENSSGTLELLHWPVIARNLQLQAITADRKRAA